MAEGYCLHHGMRVSVRKAVLKTFRLVVGCRNRDADQLALDGIFHRETDLQGDLKVANATILYVSTGPQDFKPSEVSNGLMSAL